MFHVHFYSVFVITFNTLILVILFINDFSHEFDIRFSLSVQAYLHLECNNCTYRTNEYYGCYDHYFGRMPLECLIDLFKHIPQYFFVLWIHLMHHLSSLMLLVMIHKLIRFLVIIIISDLIHLTLLVNWMHSFRRKRLIVFRCHIVLYFKHELIWHSCSTHIAEVFHSHLLVNFLNWYELPLLFFGIWMVICN